MTPKYLSRGGPVTPVTPPWIRACPAHSISIIPLNHLHVYVYTNQSNCLNVYLIYIISGMSTNPLTPVFTCDVIKLHLNWDGVKLTRSDPPIYNININEVSFLCFQTCLIQWHYQFIEKKNHFSVIPAIWIIQNGHHPNLNIY